MKKIIYLSCIWALVIGMMGCQSDSHDEEAEKTGLPGDEETGSEASEKDNSGESESGSNNSGEDDPGKEDPAVSESKCVEGVYKDSCYDDNTTLTCSGGVIQRVLCAHPFVCRDGSCVKDEDDTNEEPICEENTFSCQTGSVVKCINGESWEEVEVCEGSEICLEGIDHCLECDETQSEKTCFDGPDHPNSIKYCSEGKWVYEPCSDDEICFTQFWNIFTQTYSKTKPYCEVPCGEESQTCAPDGRLEICHNGIHSFKKCSSGLVCRDDACREPAPPECSDGQVRCYDAATLQKCVDGQWTLFEACETHTVGDDVIGCMANQCMTYCETDEDCSGGLSCAVNRCVPCVDEYVYKGNGPDETIFCTKGDFEAKSGYSNVQLSFPNLLKVGGSLKAYYPDSLNFPQLRSVGSFWAYQYSSKLKEIIFPELRTVTNTSNRSSIYIDENCSTCQIETISMPKLKSAGGLDISSDAKNVYFPELTTIYTASVYLRMLENYDFHSLTTISNGDLSISMKGDIEFPALKNLSKFGNVEIRNSQNQRAIILPEVTKLGILEIQNNSVLERVILPKVTDIQFEMIINDNPKLTEVDLSSLDTFADTNSKGAQINNNASLSCMSLCYLKDTYYPGNLVGTMSDYDDLFPGNKADAACPESGPIDWSACTE